MTETRSIEWAYAPMAGVRGEPQFQTLNHHS